MLILLVLPACGQPVILDEGTPFAGDQAAVIGGGGFPSLRAVDQTPVTRNVVAGTPDTVLPAGAHRLVIDYQPCANANSCALASTLAEVELLPGRTYDIRQAQDGCAAWAAVTDVLRLRPDPCRNYLWIEDRETGETIWGKEPDSIRS